MTDEDRDAFDALVERAIGDLPPRFAAWIARVPVIVLDRPDADMLVDLGMAPDEGDSLCGLHTGVANTEGSIEDHPSVPSQIHLFREGILLAAGGWDGPEGDAGVEHEIRVTLLHELGHQMGLDEDDLDRLGYA